MPSVVSLTSVSCASVILSALVRMLKTKRPPNKQKTVSRVPRKISIGAALRAARLERGLSLTDVARDAGISISLLSRIETGDRDDLRLSTAVALCRTLGLSIDKMANL